MKCTVQRGRDTEKEIQTERKKDIKTERQKHRKAAGNENKHKRD